MDKEFVRMLVNLYVKRSHLGEREYGAEHTGKGLSDVKKEIEINENKILSILSKVKEVMNEPKKFIKFLKELIAKDTENFQVSFAEPYLDDFINILLFDVKREKIVDEKTLDRWKETFSKEGIEINF